MQPTKQTLSENQAKRPWHPPQCTRKHWRTPKLAIIDFGETENGDVQLKTENSTGTLPAAS